MQIAGDEDKNREEIESSDGRKHSFARWEGILTGCGVEVELIRGFEGYQSSRYYTDTV